MAIETFPAEKWKLSDGCDWVWVDQFSAAFNQNEYEEPRSCGITESYYSAGALFFAAAS
jgi:hypothetical protein